MSTKFDQNRTNLQDPITSAFEITPDDDSDLADVATGLYVGTSGDVAVILANDTQEVVLPNLAAGVWHPMCVKRVLDTGTDATDIFGGKRA